MSCHCLFTCAVIFKLFSIDILLSGVLPFSDTVHVFFLTSCFYVCVFMVVCLYYVWIYVSFILSVHIISLLILLSVPFCHLVS